MCECVCAHARLCYESMSLSIPAYDMHIISYADCTLEKTKEQREILQIKQRTNSEKQTDQVVLFISFVK